MWGQKYEVKWPTYINTLFNTLVTAKTGQNCKTNNGRLICNSITQETLDELIKQLVIFDLRGFPSDNYLNHVIDSVFNTIPELANQRIPTSEQMHPTETTYKKQFKHQNVLHICYDILNGKDFSGTAKTI
ncbi:hypothetical protein [Butyrivibrio hungatei]|uniref:Uncharacterized protein n=1 Tax=Butyrivibrio hungatei TaxID=185008 RepID=A0A1D9NZX7_9FIRM|nr:hypothetical protein [Butyrivibrio hungatei]AOZ95936.1 hypothetical protein bhn_I0902 [Butyrivibrio hungatei]